MTDITKGEDIDAIRASIDRLESYALADDDEAISAEDGTDLKDDIVATLKEMHRLREKVEAIARGHSTLILSDADRGKDVVDLDDATLAQWTRWVCLTLDRIMDKRQADSEARGEPSRTLSLHAGISLALMAFNANADEAIFTVSGVTYRDQPRGDWEIIIRQIAAPEGNSEGEG